LNVAGSQESVEATGTVVRVRKMGGILPLGALLLTAVLVGAAASEPTPPSASGVHEPMVAGFDPSAIDASADPCTDFYQYACGNWIKANPVPDDQSRWVRSFSTLRAQDLDALRRELTRAARRPASPLERKTGDFFASCMDVGQLQAQGLAAVKPALERVAALSDTRGIASLMGELTAAGQPAPLFALDVEVDPADSTKSLLSIVPRGLTLPDLGDYGHGRSPYILKRYRSHIVRVFMLAGDTLERAMSEAEAVIAIEKALAKVYPNRVESADPDERYHVFELADLEKLAPNVDFPDYLNRVTGARIETLNVASPRYFKTVDRLIASAPIDSWRSYFRWHVLSDQAVALPKEFREEEFAFWGANVGHQEKAAPRWKECTALTDQVFGEALAQSWVKRGLSHDTEDGAQKLIDALEKALAGEIRTLPWMADETKSIAEQKLAAIRHRIGHPEKGRDYSGLTVDRRDFPGNLHRCAVFERHIVLGRLRSPVDPNAWEIVPTTLDARYVRSMNTLYVSAGLVRPPFFQTAADPALNFGGIGTLAAHELVHGFDGLGSKFDARGNVQDWQTLSDRKGYTEATSCEVSQVQEAKPKSDDPSDDQTPGKGDGTLAVAETTADNGALRIAFRALTEALFAQGRTTEDKIDGIPESQRFFLSFAQASCENQTFLAARRSLSADPQSVGRVRVNSAVQNFEEFGKSFHCPKGKPMYPEKSCRVW